MGKAPRGETSSEEEGTEFHLTVSTFITMLTFIFILP